MAEYAVVLAVITVATVAVFTALSGGISGAITQGNWHPLEATYVRGGARLTGRREPGVFSVKSRAPLAFGGHRPALKTTALPVDETCVEAGARDLTAPQAPALESRSGSWTLALYGTAIFLAAALVFAIQPMVAKMLLPHFGGTPAVWIVSLVFFQTALLCGYAFAHFSLRILGVRRQSFLQLGLLLVPLVTLPIAVSADAGPGDNPHLGLLGHCSRRPACRSSS